MTVADEWSGHELTVTLHPDLRKKAIEVSSSCVVSVPNCRTASCCSSVSGGLAALGAALGPGVAMGGCG